MLRNIIYNISNYVYIYTYKEEGRGTEGRMGSPFLSLEPEQAEWCKRGCIDDRVIA